MELRELQGRDGAGTAGGGRACDRRRANRGRHSVGVTAAALCALLAVSTTTRAASPPAGFTLIALGTAGGLQDGRLSSFLLAAAGSSDFVALDAGTLVTGIDRARARGSLSGPTIGDVLRTSIRGVLLSHAHLDHTLGLVIASPEDGPKPIYGMGETLDTLRDHIFNGRVWANFTDDGVEPRLGRYSCVRLRPGEETPLSKTPMTVEAHPLCHARKDSSTAFLVRNGASYLLYLGDTGSDDVEGCDRLESLWHRVAALVRERRLTAVVIEVSYADPRPDAQLFGHLTPKRLRVELQGLAAATRPERPTGALSGLTIVVTHVKPSLDGIDTRRMILDQLRQGEATDGLGVKYLMPEDGDRLDFD